MKEKVETYVREHYKKMFGDKSLFIEEFDSHFTVKSNKDESSLTSSSSVWSAIGGRLETDFGFCSESVTDGRASGETPEWLWLDPTWPPLWPPFDDPYCLLDFRTLFDFG